MPLSCWWRLTIIAIPCPVRRRRTLGCHHCRLRICDSCESLSNMLTNYLATFVPSCSFHRSTTIPLEICSHDELMPTRSQQFLCRSQHLSPTQATIAVTLPRPASPERHFSFPIEQNTGLLQRHTINHAWSMMPQSWIQALTILTHRCYFGPMILVKHRSSSNTVQTTLQRLNGLGSSSWKLPC